MAKWFLNNETGVAWEVADETVIARLEKDQNFAEISDPTKKKGGKKATAEEPAQAAGEAAE